MAIEIDHNRCKGCHLCINVCPKKCLILASQRCKFGTHMAELDKSKKCIECGNCYLVCPDRSIKLKKDKT